VLSMTEIRTGPRSERNPTAAVDVVLKSRDPSTACLDIPRTRLRAVAAEKKSTPLARRQAPAPSPER
jgi:hypothetical protein